MIERLVDGARLGKYLAGFVLLALTGWLVFQSTDLPTIRAVLLASDPVYFVLAILAYYMTIPLRTFRWQMLLEEIDVPLTVRSGNLIVMLSLFFNTLLPAKAGDIYKCHLTGILNDTSRVTVLGTATVERVIDILLLSGGVLLSIGVLTTRPRGSIEQVGFLALGIGLFVSLGTLLLLFLPFGVIPSVPNGLQDIATRYRIGVRSISSRVGLAQVVAVSLFVWTANIARFGLLILALNLDVTPAGIVFVALLVSFLTGLPYTPAGLGVVELVGVVVLVALGVPQESSAALVLLDRAITIGSVLVVGSVLYLSLHLRRSPLLRGDPLR